MSNQQQQGQADNSMGPLWITAAVFVTALAIWYFLGDYIAAGFLKIKWWEVSLLSHFTTALDVDKQFILQADPSSVKFADLLTLSKRVGHYFQIPVSVILIALSGVLYMRSAANRYNRKLNMQLLLEQEKENWPCIMPVTRLDLINAPLHDGPWAVALTPLEWGKKLDLFVEMPEETEEQQRRKGAIKVTVKKGSTRRALAMQIGPPWQGHENLPPHVKALLAIFAAKACRDRKGAADMLNQISESTESGVLDFAGVNELLEKHIHKRVVHNKIIKHHYMLTVMAGMLELARLDGVLASAEFLWLKPVDRRLWYMLNSVGRHTCVAEVAGPYAHFKAEKAMFRPLAVPMVEEAVRALEVSLEQQLYIPEAGADDDIIVEEDLAESEEAADA